MKMAPKFKKAGVPRSVWGISCQDTGRDAINAWAAGLKQNAEVAGALLSLYVRSAAPGNQAQAESFAAGQQYVELCARQAVVNGLSTRLIPFLGLLQRIENPELVLAREEEHSYQVLVLPYLPAQHEVNCTPGQYDLVVDHILGHVYDGGALVVCGSQTITKRLGSALPASLERLLTENADIVEV